jgi:hypothetical protein
MFVQDLFWKNIPQKNIRNKDKGMLTELFRESLLKDTTRPTFVYTGTNHIKQFDSLELSPKTYKKLSKGVDIYLYEPVSPYIKDTIHNNHFYSEFNTFDNLYADELDSIVNWQQKNSIKNINVYTGDYNIQKYYAKNYPTLNLFCMDIFLRDFFCGGNTTLDLNYNKKFICPNWRYTKHRHLLSAFLVDKDCYLSWNFKTNYELLMDRTWIELDKWSGTNYETIIKQNIDTLNQNIPYVLDYKNAKTTDASMKQWPVFAPQGRGLEAFYLDSMCAIVNETRFAQPTANFSEKTFNAMLYGRPFVMVGPPHTLKYIKELGFKTFDSLWNEDYDSIQNPTDRLIAIFELIEHIANNDCNLQDIEDVLIHNQKLVSKFYKNCKIL